MKKRIFSGIQPSGQLHIGNYLGAIKNWVKLQHEYDSVFCVVDLHAITVPQKPEELRKNCLELARLLLAAGIDPKISTIFVQSHLHEHAELAWILNTVAKMSDLFRMTQFKDKTGLDINKFEKYLKKEVELTALSSAVLEHPISDKTQIDDIFSLLKIPINKVGVGLFDYPVLMAADILLYDTNLVPVGEDQFQHVEITRTLGKRFNNQFGETFALPEPYFTKEVMRIMGLDDPAKKMSKSAGSEYNYIALTDDADTIRRKIKKAVTDSGSEIKYEDSKPALKNLINIYSSFSSKTPEAIEKMYQSKGYADFKNGLAEVIINSLKPLQDKMKEFTNEKVLTILREGAERLRPIARKKMDEVKKKVGFIL